MFENLSEKLQRAFKALRGEATLNEENIQEALRAIRLALAETRREERMTRLSARLRSLR